MNQNVICTFDCVVPENIHTPPWRELELLWKNQKQKKKLLGKENETTSPKKKEQAPFCQAKKKNLAESDKGSWFVR